MVKEVMSIEQILNTEWFRATLLEELNLPETPLGKGHSFNELIYLVVEKYHPGATKTKEFEILWVKNQIALYTRCIQRDCRTLNCIPQKERSRRKMISDTINEETRKVERFEKRLKELTTSTN